MFTDALRSGMTDGSSEVLLIPDEELWPCRELFALMKTFPWVA